MKERYYLQVRSYARIPIAKAREELTSLPEQLAEKPDTVWPKVIGDQLVQGRRKKNAILRPFRSDRVLGKQS